MIKQTLAAITSLIVLNGFFVVTVLASPYGCGTYNAQTYSDSCSTASSSKPKATTAVTGTDTSSTSTGGSNPSSGPNSTSTGGSFNQGFSEEPSPSSETESADKAKGKERVVGLVIGLLLITGAVWWLLWYRRRRHHQQQYVPPPTGTPNPPSENIITG